MLKTKTKFNGKDVFWVDPKRFFIFAMTLFDREYPGRAFSFLRSGQ